MRKTWLDEQEIERHPDSIVFYADVKEVVEVMIGVRGGEDIGELVLVYLETMGLMKQEEWKDMEEMVI